MDYQIFFRAFFLIYNWEVRIKASREELINLFNSKFKTKREAIGYCSWKTIYFMCPTIGGALYNSSLIGFEGVIEEKQPESTIHLKARFGQPFLLMYIIPAFLFPILYITDYDGAREDLNMLDNHFLNIIIPPTIIWSAVMIYYQFKILHAKKFITESLKELQEKMNSKQS